MDSHEPRLTYQELRAAALIAVAALLAGAVLLLFLRQILSVLIIFYFSVVFSHALEPVIGMGERVSIPRLATIALVYLLLLVAIGLALFLIIPPLVFQVTSLIQSLPEVLLNLETSLQSYTYLTGEPDVATLIQSWGSRLGQQLLGMLDELLVVPLRLSGIVVILVSIPIISFYWLVDSVRIENTFLSLLPPAHRDDARVILAEMATKTGAWIRGQLIAMFTVGLLTFIGLWILGVPYALFLAVIAGLLEAIPFIGPPTSAIPSIVVALLISPILAGEVVVLYIIIQQVESNIIVPNVMNREVGLHPLTVLVAVWIGGSLLGLAGALLSIPVSASLQVLFFRVMAPWIRSWKW